MQSLTSLAQEAAATSKPAAGGSLAITGPYGLLAVAGLALLVVGGIALRRSRSYLV